MFGIVLNRAQLYGYEQLAQDCSGYIVVLLLKIPS